MDKTYPVPDQVSMQVRVAGGTLSVNIVRMEPYCGIVTSGQIVSCMHSFRRLHLPAGNAGKVISFPITFPYKPVKVLRRQLDQLWDALLLVFSDNLRC